MPHRHARQAARRHEGLGPAQYKGAQIDVARLDSVAGERGHGRERNYRLRDRGARGRFQLRSELSALALAGGRSHEHTVASGAIDGLDHERIQMGKDVIELIGLASAPRWHVRQYGGLVEIKPNHVWDVGVHELIVSDTRTGSVSERNVALRPGPH